MMTPKEKANELFDKYYDYLGMPDCIAKECTLIAVDEILEGLGYNKLSDSPYTTLEARQYYVQVKKEIENL